MEETTRAVVLPAQEGLRTEMQNTRQDADKSLEVHIARIQKMGNGPSMVSDDSDQVRRQVTMKLQTAVTDEFMVASTMVKTLLNSTCIFMLVMRSAGSSLFPH